MSGLWSTDRPDLEDILIAWGRLYGKDRAYMEDRSPTGNSTLARIMGKPKNESTVGRNGIRRRTLMARELGGCGVRIVSGAYVDPVSGKQTRSHKPDADPRETPTLVVVQSAWLALHRVCELEATALRLHYQRRDMSREQRAKALRLTVRAYRDRVARARAFIQERLIA